MLTLGKIGGLVNSRTLGYGLEAFRPVAPLIAMDALVPAVKGGSLGSNHVLGSWKERKIKPTGKGRESQGDK
jgi:hypothetical protein